MSRISTLLWAMLYCLSSLSAMPAMAATNAATIATNAITPDFSGIWLPETRRTSKWPATPPFTAAAQQTFDRYKAAYVAQFDDENRSCIPYAMPALMAGTASYTVEVVQIPGRISIFFEQHMSIRNIYIDGRARPADVSPTHMGYSLGKWEGLDGKKDTLVVETSGFRAAPGGRPTSENMRVVERFHLLVGPSEKNGKTLVDDITVYDPQNYSEPLVIHKYFTWSPDIEIGEYLCNEDIWMQNLTGSKSDIPWRK